MTPRKTKPKYWLESPKIKSITWIIWTPVILIFTIYQTYWMATSSAPKAKTVEANFTNSELGIFEVRVCNEWQNPINWEKWIDSHSTDLKFEDSNWINIKIDVNHPITSTPENPACITMTWSVKWDYYWTGKFFTECDWNGVYMCGSWNDPGKNTFRSERNYIVIDAWAQSYEDAKSWEKYDSINPKIISNILKNTHITQAPWNGAEIRDWVYQNPQKRVVICWNLTEEEKVYYKWLIRENFPQYIYDPLFCSREELLTLQDADLRAFFGYIWDCDVRTTERWRICTPDWRLYTRWLHENNPDSIVIAFPTISEDLKIK